MQHIVFVHTVKIWIWAVRGTSAIVSSRSGQSAVINQGQQVFVCISIPSYIFGASKEERLKIHITSQNISPSLTSDTSVKTMSHAAHTHISPRLCSLPFLMTNDVEVELGGPEVSLVSGLEGVGGLRPQEVIGALWEGRKLVGWEQFWKYITTPIGSAAKWVFYHTHRIYYF